jgi:hypothetical protein
VSFFKVIYFRVEALDSMLHFEKSIGCLQFLQVCGRSNSSEKISFSVPQLGHLQVNEVRFLFASKPGQCIGVLI